MNKTFMIYTATGRLQVFWDGFYVLGGALMVLGTIIFILGLYFIALRTTGI